VKQDFGLEDARVRTFRRLENLFALCYLAYHLVQFHLPNCSRFHNFVKIFRDNAVKLSTRAEVLLANVRELLREARVKFICGRPRKRSCPDAYPSQLLLAL